ncbi:hypothetical protein [Salinispora fenicalii]|nr:hypothetical protein [Salinispora fenicalii]
MRRIKIIVPDEDLSTERGTRIDTATGRVEATTGPIDTAAELEAA